MMIECKKLCRGDFRNHVKKYQIEKCEDFFLLRFCCKMVKNLPAINMNVHRKCKPDIFKTIGIVYGMTKTQKENRSIVT